MTRRRWFWAGLLAAIAIGLLLVLFRWEPSWTLTLESNRRYGTPWSTFELKARAQALRSGASLSLTDWSWRWQLDGGDLPGEGPTRRWRSGVVGSHRVSVIATSPRGSRKTAHIDLVIRPTAVTSDLKGIVLPSSQPDPSVHDVPFGFADIVVEKSEVCVGEPSLIRATPVSRNGWTGNLLTSIAGDFGSAGSFVRLVGEPGMRKVAVTLRDPEIPGKWAEEEVYIMLKDCVAPATLVVESMPDPTVADRYSFRARLLQLARGKPPAPLDSAASISWDFGDGHKEATNDLATGHVFPSEGERPASEHFHTYLVTAEAFDAYGTSLAKAYHSVLVTNLRRQSKTRFGLVELPARFRDLAEMDGEGNKSMPVTLENIDSVETVRLTEVQLRSVSCDGQTQTTATVSAESIFPTSAIAPNASVSGVLTISAADQRNVCRVYATATGDTTPSSLAAIGFFAMTVGEGGAFQQPVTDAKQLEVIRKVITLLGKSNFTEDDVRKLEDQGKIPRGALTRTPPPPPPLAPPPKVGASSQP